MCTDFVLQVKCTIVWLNRDLMVYLDLYAPDFPKSNSKSFLHPRTFRSKIPYFGGVFGKKKQKKNSIMDKTPLATTKYENLVNNTFNI